MRALFFKKANGPWVKLLQAMNSENEKLVQRAREHAAEPENISVLYCIVDRFPSGISSFHSILCYEGDVLWRTCAKALQGWSRTIVKGRTKWVNINPKQENLF
jgi:hypothetical protein